MAGVLFCWKSKNNVPLEFLSIGNTKIRYGCGFNSFKMLKKGMTVVLIFLEC